MPHRILGILLVVCLLSAVTAAAGDSDASIRPGLRINFAYIVEHVEQKSFWSLSVLQGNYPDAVGVSWVRPQKDGPNLEGRRIYSNLKYSRVFQPIFSTKENNKTMDSTAPWLSQQIYRELAETHTATGFKEGGTHLIGQSLTTLKIQERVDFPVRINGEPAFVKAFKLNRGITVWDNPANPLVLRYEPMGIPFVSGVVGWKVVDIRY